MRKAEEISERSRCILHYFCILSPLWVTGAIVVGTVVAFSVSAWRMTEAMSAADVSALGVAFRLVAGNMRPLLEANRSAFAVAGAMSNESAAASFSHVGPKLFVAFAMQPLLAQVSYAGRDGAAFAYYRGEHGEARALFRDSRGRWYTQSVDPATGRLIGPAAAAVRHPHLPNSTQVQVLLASKSAGARASVGAGWARRDVRMLLFSAPVGDAGVVSAGVAVDDVVGAAASRIGFRHGMDVYYAVGDNGGGAPAAYKPFPGDQSQIRDDAATSAEEMRLFSKVKCAASAIDAPKLGQLVAVGHDRKYKVACTDFDVYGVRLGLRLVLHSRRESEMLRAACIAVVALVCALVAVAAAACVLAARALRRAAAREAALNADLVQQKEVLRQAERKSMNKSNAFASASHDIRSALAAIAGLVEVSRPETQGHPNVLDNLNQMAVCTNKLFDILNTILDTSKVESGKMQLEEAEFNMADVLEESVDMVNVVGVNKGIEVVWDPCDFSVLKCENVVGDCKRLKQILDNLLGNALKFTQEGHVVLRAWANRPIARSSISVPSRFARGRSFFRCLFRAREDRDEHGPYNNVQNDPNSVEFYFEVVDTGIGIPREKRESVFENYVQVKDGQGGTGLGLGIVQSFVRLMGGEINILDKEAGERGTCFGFNVLLKISERQEPQDIEEGTSTRLNDSNFRASMFKEVNSFKGGHCVLYVHGEETRRILQNWMESIGMKVWLIPRVELIASTLEKVQHNSMSPARGSSPFVDCDAADRCFSSKDMVSQVLPMALRNNNGPRRGSWVGYPSGILVIIDVSNGGLEEIRLEMVKFLRIKHQTPCKVVLLADLKTSSDDLRRFKELISCDLILRKPMHGSRLHTLLLTLRDFQASETQGSSQVGPGIAGTTQQDLPGISSQVGPGIAGTSQQDLPGIVIQDVPETSAISNEVALAPEQNTEDDKPLAGMHVLLVEDTSVLQTIQRKMLNQLGATVDLAEDGCKAVESFKQAIEKAYVSEEDGGPLAYHVIFMDCQMPIMDGYEATKLIREEENRYGIHTPIIALTAHSMEEDQQKAILAGMDLHLTKPIERKRVVEAVYEACKRKN